MLHGTQQISHGDEKERPKFISQQQKMHTDSASSQTAYPTNLSF